MPPRGGRPAGPSAAQVVRSVRAQVAKGWPPGLTVLTGDDVYHLDEAQQALLSHLVPEESSDFALTVFSEGKTPVADVVSAARSLPMFAVRRVVFVREATAIEGEPGPLQSFAQAPPGHSYLVVRAPKLDLRRPLHQSLARAGRLLEFRASSPAGEGETIEEIVALARGRELAIDPTVAAFLHEVCAGDLHRVVRELEKLDSWAGPGAARKVPLGAARELCSGGGGMDGWEAAEAILDRNPGGAVEAVRRLLDGGREPLLVLGGIAWRARTLLQGKAMLESGAGPEEVTQALKAWGYRDRLLGGLRRYALAELLAFPARLREADLALKSRGLDARVVLESLVADLTRRREPAVRREGP